MAVDDLTTSRGSRETLCAGAPSTSSSVRLREARPRASKSCVMLDRDGVALSLFAMVSVNILGVLAIISLSACISLLFPTIYGEALMGLGEDTKYGAAGLVMAIIGGATMPLVQSAIMDHTSPAVSYVTVAGCFLVVAAYGLYTLRSPRPISAA